MKSLASESKQLQSCSRVEFPAKPGGLGRSKLKEPFLIDSDAELFKVYIRFGS